MVDQADLPIVVNADPIPAQVVVAVRSILVMLGSSLVTNGVLTDAQLQVVIGALIVIGPFVWQQWRSRRNTQKLVTLAQKVPDSVAQVK